MNMSLGKLPVRALRPTRRTCRRERPAMLGMEPTSLLLRCTHSSQGSALQA